MMFERLFKLLLESLLSFIVGAGLLFGVVLAATPELTSRAFDIHGNQACARNLADSALKQGFTLKQDPAIPCHCAVIEGLLH